MSDIVILRAALEALNRADNEKTETSRSAGEKPDWAAGAPASDRQHATSATVTENRTVAERASLLPELGQNRDVDAAGIDDRAVYFDDDLDSESVRLLALKAQQQLSIQALAIANVRALSIIGLFRDDDPPIRLM